MKILFATFYDPNYLGLRYLAATMKNAGHQVAIVQLKDFRHAPMSPADAGAHIGYFFFIYRKIRKNYPQYKDIVTCAAL